MQLKDFEVGKTYKIKKKDWVAPDGSGTIQGKSIIREVLPAATKENSRVREIDLEGTSIEEPLDSDIDRWRKYLRVRNPETKNVHLLDPDSIDFAEVSET